jgi:hypothetical protein
LLLAGHLIASKSKEGWENAAQVGIHPKIAAAGFAMA